MVKARLGSSLLLSSFALITAVLSAGCGGGGAASLCDAAFDCGSLSKTEYDDCIADFERLQKEAEQTGCSTQFDAAITCAEDEGTCKAGQFSAFTCNNQWQAFETCAGN